MLQVLATAASKRAPESLQTFSRFIHEHPEYAADAAPVLYNYYLAPAFMPVTEDYLDGSEPALILESVAVLLLLTEKLSSLPQVQTLLKPWWPQICSWFAIIARYSTRVRSHALLLPLHIKAIVATLALAIKEESFWSIDLISPAMVLWTQVYESAHLRQLLDNTDDGMRLLGQFIACCVQPVGVRFGRDVLIITNLVEEDTPVFIKSAISHIRHAFSGVEEANVPDDLDAIDACLETLRTLDCLCKLVCFGLTFPFAHIMPTVMQFLRMMVQSPVDHRNGTQTLSHVETCLAIIPTAFENGQDTAWLEIALEMDILEIIQTLSPWLVHASRPGNDARPHAKFIEAVIRNTFTPCLVYRSVTAAVLKAFRRLERAGDPLAVNLGRASSAWKTFRKTATLYNGIFSNIPASCGNKKVGCLVPQLNLERVVEECLSVPKC